MMFLLRFSIYIVLSALSLNLNLIEHPWDETQRQLNKVQPELNLVHNSGGFGLIFLWH
jgi:hypothetical protein